MVTDDPTRPYDIEGARNGAADVSEREHALPVPGATKRGLIYGRAPWLDLPPPWDDLEIKTWLDYPKAIADLWTPADDETTEERVARTTLACQNTFLDHRAACDCKPPNNGDNCRVKHEPWEIPGEGVLPPPNEAEFWELIPTPLFKAIIDRFVEEVNVNPTNRASRRWKRQNSKKR